MDGKDSCLFCGVVGLQTEIGSAVAVALDVFVDLILNNRPEHGAILHIPINLKRLMHEIHYHFGFGKALRFGNCENTGFGGNGRSSPNLGGLPRF